MDATIHLRDDYHLIKIIINEDDGSRVEKEITRKTFGDIFKQESSNEYFCRNEMFKTFTDIEHIEGLIYGKKQQKEMMALFFVPTSKKYVNVAGEETMIPYPSLLFKFMTKAGVLTNSLCYAVKEKNMSKLKPETRLYNFPFGNVDTYNHHICWGTNKMTALYNYEDLRKAITTFFYSESNKDYVIAGKSFHKRYGSYEDFLKNLKDREQFPANALILCDENLTLKNVFEKMYTKKEEN